MYLATEEARDRVVENGLTIKGLWHHAKLWAQALHTPRCFKCNGWDTRKLHMRHRRDAGIASAPQHEGLYTTKEIQLR